MNQKNIIIVVATIAVLALIGGGYWFYQSSSDQSAKNNAAINSVKVEDLNLDFSLSPMPALDISSFNIPMPELTGEGSFSGIKVNSDFSYTGEVKLSAPSYEFNVSIPSGVPTTLPTGAPASTGAPATVPTTTSTSAPAQTGAPAGQTTDCSAFSATPSCSVVGGGEAYTLCKQCFPNK